MDRGEAKKLKQLEEENRKLKRVVADLTLDNRALKDMLSKTARTCGTSGSRALRDAAVRDQGTARLQADGLVARSTHRYRARKAGRVAALGAASGYSTVSHSSFFCQSGMTCRYSRSRDQTSVARAT
jgi:hypothetical protein